MFQIHGSGRSWAPAAAALALAACAAVPDRVEPATARDPSSLASSQSFSAAPSTWPEEQWWRAYGDTQLDALIEEAIAQSPTLAEAEARLRAADAVRAGRVAAAGASVSANGFVVEQEQSQNAGIPADFIPSGYEAFGRATLDFSYELDFWGRNRAGIEAATSQARAAAADAAQARLALSTAIAAAYADLARLHANRAILERSLEVRSETATLVTRRVEVGLDNLGAQRQAEAGPPATRADIAFIDELIAQTRNRLASLLGAGPDRGLAIAPPQAPALHAFGLPENLAVDLVGRRPDLVAARWRAEAATASTREARAAFYPNVNLMAFIGTEALGLDNLTQESSRIGSIGPAISLPIFDSGRLGANLQRADAERDAAVAAYNGALSEALHEVADVAASERSLSVRLAESRAALAANEEAYRIARQRYEGGLATYLSVLITEDSLLAQRRSVADLESRAFVLDVALVRALGGGFGAS